MEATCALYLCVIGAVFEPAELAQKPSVGLSNVRFRLKQTVNGEMKLESTLNRGTRVTTTIPHT